MEKNNVEGRNIEAIYNYLTKALTLLFHEWLNVEKYQRISGRSVMSRY